MRREEIGEENKQSSLEEIFKYRAEAQQKVKERNERAKQAAEAAKERNKQANKGNEEGRRERESGGGVHHEAKFETKGEKKKDLVGRERNKEEKQRSSPRGKVEAEKARPMEETKVEAKGREKDVPPWLLSCFIYLFNESDIDIKVVGCGSVNLVEIITTILS